MWREREKVEGRGRYYSLRLPSLIETEGRKRTREQERGETRRGARNSPPKRPAGKFRSYFRAQTRATSFSTILKFRARRSEGRARKKTIGGEGGGERAYEKFIRAVTPRPY